MIIQQNEKTNHDTTEDFPDEQVYVFKLLVVGEASVGKTSLVRRYVDQTWDPRTLKTIGVDFSLKNVDVPVGEPNTRVKLQIWDFGGEDRFMQLLPIYAQGTHGIFYCFDLSRPETLEKLKDWERVLARILTRPAVSMVLGLKSDLVSETTYIELQPRMKELLGIQHVMNCSAKTGENVENAFLKIATLIHDRFFQKISNDENESMEDKEKRENE